MRKSELKKLIKEEIRRINEDVHEAYDFNRTMEDLEDMLQKQNSTAWEQFEKESGELWRELDNAQDWADAFQEDPLACIAHKQKLLSLIESKSKAIKNIIKEEIRRIIEDKISNLTDHLQIIWQEDERFPNNISFDEIYSILK